MNDFPALNNAAVTKAEPRKLPNIKLSKRARKEFDEWTARIEAEDLHVGKAVRATRVILKPGTQSVQHKWMEPAVIIEIRNFAALVKFQDGTVESSMLGMSVDDV